MKAPLSAEQEKEAQELAVALAEGAAAEFLQLARTLVGSEPASLFGQTEFTIRDLLLRVGARAYQEHLAQKKTATRAPA